MYKGTFYFANDKTRFKVVVLDESVWVIDDIHPSSLDTGYVSDSQIKSVAQSQDNPNDLIIYTHEETIVLAGWLKPRPHTMTDDEVVAVQLKYTPPHEVLTVAQTLTRERMSRLSDDAFLTQTAGLKSAFDLLDKLVYVDCINELAGALEVITLLCSVDNQRYYNLLKDPKYADVVGMMTGGVK